MKPSRKRQRSAESGLSLIELLVSVTILALATTVALVVYDQARLAYKQGENVTEQQQVVRIAYDLVGSDIRMAGFNTNPDANRARPDEQIEAAYATAITVRADFDADDPAKVDSPEQALGGAGSAFLAVSTGNDEIVTYALGKEDGSSPDSVVFGADVGALVRDGSIETVMIDALDLTQTAPPYTLYKIVLDNDPTGCCAGSFVSRIPIVDNVRSLRFQYFDRAGNVLTPPGGDETDAARATRAAIRRVGIEVEALTRDSDPHWVDLDDPDPTTRKFRKFRLVGEVAPPNLGRTAIKDLQADSTAPGTPGTPSLYPGHCKGLFVDWPANPAQDEVAYYRVEYGTNPGNLSSVRSSHLPGVYLSGLADGVTYYASLQAVDAAGNRSASSTQAFVATSNTNTPAATLGLSAATGTAQIELAWSAALDNTGATSGDPASPKMRDLAGYRVYRSSTPGFTPAASNRVADENSVAALPSPVFFDTQVAHCKTYYFRVAATDGCGVEGAVSNQASGASWSDVNPIAPLNVQAFLSGSSQVKVTWSAVQEDVNGNPVYIDKYNIYRSPFQPDNIDDPASWTYLDQVVGATEYTDSILIPAGQTVHYLIKALDSCSPSNESVLSEPAHPSCNFSGSVVIDEPAYGAMLWGNLNIGVRNVNAIPTVVNESVLIEFVAETDGTTWTTSSLGYGGFQWNYSWDADPSGYPTNFFKPGPYLVTAIVEQRDGAQLCDGKTTIRVHLGP